jgi:hypothetical protein
MPRGCERSGLMVSARKSALWNRMGSYAGTTREHARRRHYGARQPADGCRAALMASAVAPTVLRNSTQIGMDVPLSSKSFDE